MFKRVFVLIIFTFATLVGAFSQTVLSAGDIVIVAMNTDGTDDFSFITLVPITTTTVIKFAESGWLNAGGFRGGGSGSEGTITWTANANLSCGSEITITSTGTVASSGITVVSGSWALSTSGDQILAYQGSSATPTFIYAINNEGAGIWQADATSTNTSAIPTGLTNGTNAVAVFETDNVKYDCSTITPTASILAAVSNNANWLSDDINPYVLPIACGFTCTACVIAGEPTVNSSSLVFSNIDCYRMDLSWAAGNGANRIVVASTSPIAGTPTDQSTYSSNSVFGVGSTIAAGEFVVYNGSGTSVTVSGLTPSTTYYYAVFEYNGVLANCEENYLITFPLTGNIPTIACVCPEITGILVDACGGAVEGINEFFTFQNGNSTLEIDSLTATFPSGGSFCNSGCAAQNWTTNPTYVASLNTTAGCGGLFVEANPIPAGEEVIVFTGAVPTYNFDFTGLCGTGPYYAVFANNASTSGRFANYAAGCGNFRTLNIDFGAFCSDSATYERCLLSNTNGDYVTFDAAGNPTYQNDGCTPSAILPISLIYFKGKSENTKNILEWSTTSEINNDYFNIEKSNDALNFVSIGQISGVGNSNIQIFYQFIDVFPSQEINYYRLKQTDFDGKFSYSEIISINNKFSDINIFVTNNILYIKANESTFKEIIKIYDITGREVFNSLVKSQINLSSLVKGIYTYRLISKNNIFSKKFIIN